MHDGELRIALVTLGAAALVLVAPLLGRADHPLLADLAMSLAALAGLGAFALAAAATWRASRRRGGDPE